MYVISDCVTLAGETSSGTSRTLHINVLLSQVGKAGIGAQQWRVLKDSLGLVTKQVRV